MYKRFTEKQVTQMAHDYSAEFMYKQFNLEYGKYLDKFNSPITLAEIWHEGKCLLRDIYEAKDKVGYINETLGIYKTKYTRIREEEDSYSVNCSRHIANLVFIASAFMAYYEYNFANDDIKAKLRYPNPDYGTICDGSVCFDEEQGDFVIINEEPYVPIYIHISNIILNKNIFDRYFAEDFQQIFSEDDSILCTHYLDIVTSELESTTEESTSDSTTAYIAGIPMPKEEVVRLMMDCGGKVTYLRTAIWIINKSHRLGFEYVKDILPLTGGDKGNISKTLKAAGVRVRYASQGDYFYRGWDEREFARNSAKKEIRDMIDRIKHIAEDNGYPYRG